MKKNRIIELLNKFRNKAGCIHSQYVTVQIFNELRDLLSKEDSVKLSIAHSHYQIGEGADELYNICNQLIQKYGNTNKAF